MPTLAQSLTIVVLVFLSGLAYWTFRKVRSIALRLSQVPTRRDLDNLYRQLEALDTLHRDLGFSRSIPPLRGFAGSPDFLLALSGYIRKTRPARVLELGSGASTLVIARALQLCGGGRVISLEHDANYFEETANLIKEHGLGDFVTVLHAPLIDYSIKGARFRWYSLRDLPAIEFEMLSIDGPPESTQSMARYPALPLLASRLAASCVVVADDTNREDETAMLQRWREEFRDFVEQYVPCEKGCVALIRGQGNRRLLAA